MNACKSLLTVVFAVGSQALFAGYDTTYVSQYTDGSGNPYYAGAPEGAHVYAKLADGYANVNAGGTVWVEDGFVCEEGNSEAHGYNRLNIGKVLTMRSRSGKWETGAEIRGAYNSESAPSGKEAVRAIFLNHGSGLTLIGFRLVHGAAGRADGKEGGAVKCGGLDDAWRWSPSTFQNCLFADNYGSAIYGKTINPIKIVDCVFTNNNANSTSGSCVYNCLVDHCRFEGNVGGTAVTLMAGSSATNCVFISNSTSGNGEGALAGTDVSLVGCKFINNSSTHNLTSYGGVRGTGSMTNCLFTGNYAKSSAAAVGGTWSMIDCVVTNNTAAYGPVVSGSVLTNCLIACNKSGKLAAVSQSTCQKCVIRGNNGGNWGGGAYQSVLTDCQLVGNCCSNDTVRYTSDTTQIMGGGAYESTLTNCLVAGNSTRIMCSNYGTYGYGGGLYKCTAVTCVITNNETESYGGGLYASTCYDSLIAGNVSGRNRDMSSWSTGGWGGGGAYVHLYGCVVSNNMATYRGAGLYQNSEAYTNMNCVIVANVLDVTNDYQSVCFAGGAAVFGGTYFNCLMTRHLNKAPYGSVASTPFLYNSTVIDNTNTAANACAGTQAGRGVNSIVAANVTTKAQADTFLYATNCYVSTKADRINGKYKLEDVFINCVRGDDPKLETLDGVAYVPRQHSPCKNAALEFEWMRDSADIRSKDLAGKPRILGGAPDMGCYERKGKGLQLLVR